MINRTVNHSIPSPEMAAAEAAAAAHLGLPIFRPLHDRACAVKLWL